MKRISKVADRIAPSMIRQLFNLAKTMAGVVDFTLGDPDIMPNIKIREAACRAILEGKTRYSQNAGLLELREVISNRLHTGEGLSYVPNGEVAVTVGAMEGLYLTLLALINHGDEVIIPAPYYVNYKQMVEMCGGMPVIVNPSDKKRLLVSGDDIRSAVTCRTKIILINSPSNPSGRIMPPDTVREISEIVKERNLIAVTDEVYKKLNYGAVPFLSIASIPGMKDRTVIVNSLSKEFCMTGYRIGYVAGPEDIIGAVTKLQENVAACAPLPSQYAAIEALGSDEDYSKDMVDIFTTRRNALCDILERSDRLRVLKPDATFYAMVDISGLGYASSLEFAYDLLEKAHVAVVPGVAYGDICKDFIRIAFTLEENRLRLGAQRIIDFVNSLKK